MLLKTRGIIRTIILENLEKSGNSFGTFSRHPGDVKIWGKMPAFQRTYCRLSTTNTGIAIQIVYNKKMTFFILRFLITKFEIIA